MHANIQKHRRMRSSIWRHVRSIWGEWRTNKHKQAYNKVSVVKCNEAWGIFLKPPSYYVCLTNVLVSDLRCKTENIFCSAWQISRLNSRPAEALARLLTLLVCIFDTTSMWNHSVHSAKNTHSFPAHCFLWCRPSWMLPAGWYHQKGYFWSCVPQKYYDHNDNGHVCAFSSYRFTQITKVVGSHAASCDLAMLKYFRCLLGVWASSRDLWSLCFLLRNRFSTANVLCAAEV